MYSILLEKEYFHFCSAHFVIFGRNKREELHGHNYYVSVELKNSHLEIGKLIDITKLKRKICAICDYLDHKILLPDSNPYLEIKIGLKNVEATHAESDFSFPVNDVLVLAINNSTMENLAYYISTELFRQYPILTDMKEMIVKVRETVGQSAKYVRKVKDNF